MFTIIETPLFTKMVNVILSQEERENFYVYIAHNPEAGDVIPESGGCRKIRWRIQGRDKSSGARVIYYNQLADGIITMLIIYTKTKTANIPTHILKELQERSRALKYGTA